MPEPVKVYFKNLVFDPDNPNQMSEEQETGMDAMLHEYGFVENIIVQPKDDKGMQLIHHGEHRIKRLMNAGNKWAWGVERDLTSEQHRLLRQGMNKLHGTHDPEKDAKEYEILQKAGQLDMLSILIAQPVEQLMVEKQIAPVTKDVDPIQHHENIFLHGNMKSLHFLFDNDGYENIMPRLDKIIEHTKIDNNTDVFIKLVETFEKYNFNQEE